MTQVDILITPGGILMKSGVILMTRVGYLDEMCYRLANMGGKPRQVVPARKEILDRASRGRNICSRHGSRQPGNEYWAAPPWE